MKLKNASVLAAVAATLLSSAAFAADLGQNSSLKDSPKYAVDGPIVNFTGFYIGGGVGYGNANHNLTVQVYDEEDTFNLLNSHGFIGEGRIGYDRAFGRILVGVFGSYSLNNMETNFSVTELGSGNIEKGDEWSVGGRAGVIVAPRTLAYILAAYTRTDYTINATDGMDTFSKETKFDGISVGGGVEFAVTSNIFLGMEYTHTFYGKEAVLDTGATPVDGFGARLIDDLDEDKIMATLKIKLNGIGN